jgi:hypothetical protein
MVNRKNTYNTRIEKEHDEIPQVFKPNTVPCEEAVVISLKDALLAEFAVVTPWGPPPLAGQTWRPLPVGVSSSLNVRLNDGG